MPINPTTLKALIDTQITNETVDFAITPAEVGGRMKDTIDYTTEQKALSEVLTNKSTNVNLGTSDTLYPTQNAVKTFVQVNIADTLFDINQDLADLNALKENIANKSTNVTTDGASNTKYPSVKAVKDYVDANVGGTSVVKSVKVTLTPLQVQSLFTTPIKVIDCVAGNAVFPIQMLCVANNAVSGYSPNGGGAVLRYESLAVNILSCNTTLGSFGEGEGYAISVSSTTNSGFSRNGEDIYIKMATADPVGGDSGLVVYITYSEVTL